MLNELSDPQATSDFRVSPQAAAEEALRHIPDLIDDLLALKLLMVDVKPSNLGLYFPVIGSGSGTLKVGCARPLISRD